MRLKANFRSIILLVMMAVASPTLAGPSILFDVGSGKVLAHEEAFRRWYPASLTKLMTAYVTFRAIEAGELTLTSPIRMTAKSAAEPPSKMGYKPGSVLTLDNALKIIIIKSANDVATAIGENVAGSEEAFVRRMNAQARRLGMSGTRFANANGLHSVDQYTTARDLAILVRAIRNEFPQYADYFAIEALAAGKTVMKSYNLLVGRFAGADGMKTGFICPSGFNLIASATRNGRTLSAVVLGAKSGEDRAFEAAELLAKGFDGVDFGGASLDTLQPYGLRGEATDMRPIICTSEAAADRRGERDGDDSAVVRSPHLEDRDRPPRTVAVGLGGATGPVPLHAPIVSLDIARIPIPTPRPDYQPDSVPGKKNSAAADVPAPTPRIQ
jgi:D-alanyl-D-alanine carboxypeptidase